MKHNLERKANLQIYNLLQVYNLYNLCLTLIWEWEGAWEQSCFPPKSLQLTVISSLRPDPNGPTEDHGGQWDARPSLSARRICCAAVKVMVSRVPPNLNSYRVCFSHREPLPPRSYTSFSCKFSFKTTLVGSFCHRACWWVDQGFV